MKENAPCMSENGQMVRQRQLGLKVMGVGGRVGSTVVALGHPGGLE